MKSVVHDIAFRLQSVMSRGEAVAVSRLLVEKVLRVSSTQAYLLTFDEVPGDKYTILQESVDRLLLHEPIQYVLGEAEFMHHVFKVAPGVLIPRVETEELVECVVSDWEKESAPILVDAGTGSGCIAISLKKAMPHAHVIGFDISEIALGQARTNACRLGADVHFFQADMLLDCCAEDAEVDVLVSNPPYVCLSEKAGMEKRVKEYEPSEALFVPDEDPLKYYRALALLGRRILKPTGKLYVEINSALGPETCQLFLEQHYQDIQLHTDTFGKDRIVTCRKS